METLQDVIDWLTLLINSKYFETTEDTSRAVRVLKRIDRERSTMSKDEETVDKLCTASYVLLKKAVKEIDLSIEKSPIVEEIHKHLHMLSNYGFHD